MTTASPRLLAARARRLRRRGKPGTPLQPTHFEVWAWDRYGKAHRQVGLAAVDESLAVREKIDRMRQSALGVGSSVFKAMKRFLSRGRGR